MNALRWLDRNSSTDAMHARLADASDALARSLGSAQHALSQRGAAGMDTARAWGEDMLGGARRLGRSTQGLMAERPVQTALLIGVAGFALGWIARRARELRAAHDTQPAAARAAPRARPRRRARKATDAAD